MRCKQKKYFAKLSLSSNIFSTASKNIQIKTNLQSRLFIRDSNKNKVIQYGHVKCLKKQGNVVTTNYAAINTLERTYN